MCVIFYQNFDFIFLKLLENGKAVVFQRRAKRAEKFQPFYTENIKEMSIIWPKFWRSVHLLEKDYGVVKAKAASEASRKISVFLHRKLKKMSIILPKF